MDEFDKLVLAKNRLMASMGERFPLYMKHMKKWFKMQCSKYDFDHQVRNLMTPEQQELHNNVLIQLFSVCSGLAERPPSPASCRAFLERNKKRVSKKQHTSGSSLKRPHGVAFQSVTVNEYATVKKMLVRCKIDVPEVLNYVQQERSSIDENMLFGRLTTAAWENNLDGVRMEAALVLSIGVKNFLKNSIVAVLNQRNGCKVRDGSFMYAMGTSIPNPWIRPTPKPYGPRFANDPYYYGLVKRKVSTLDSFCMDDIRLRKNVNNQQMQIANVGNVYESGNETTYRGQREQNKICDSPRINYNSKRSSGRKKISLPELYNSVRANRNAVMSNSIYFLALEKIITKMYHPSWEEIDAYLDKKGRIKK